MSVEKKIMEVEMFHEENAKRETTRKKTKCVSIARLAVLIFIFFSFGAVLGFYGPLIQKDTSLLFASGRTVSFAKRYELSHEHLPLDWFHEETCLNHSDAEWALEGRVVGGSNGNIADHPWQVSVQFNTDVGEYPYRHFCGGAVIAPSFVLTAAHCFEGDLKDRRKWEKLSILAGSTLTDIGKSQLKDLFGVQIRKINAVEIHPDWDPSKFYNDFALLMLDKNLIYRNGNHGVRPICMPKWNEQENYDLQILRFVKENSISCNIAGWGVTKPDGEKASNSLQVASLPWIESAHCQYLFNQMKTLKTKVRVQDFMLCFGKLAGGTDACLGDSGGSMSCEIDGVSLSLGVVSFGIGCAKEGHPGVYARTSFAAEWALKTMKTMNRLKLRKGFSVPLHWQKRAECMEETNRRSKACNDILLIMDETS